MKELIALLLAAVMCLSLAACGKEIKDDTAYIPVPVATEVPAESEQLPAILSKYMPILCGDWEILYRDDLGLFENITFSEDGTLKVDNQTFTWEYAWDYDGVCVFNILDGSTTVGGFRLHKEKDACLELWLDHIESRGRIFFYQPSCYDIITITLDNWQEYFEIRQFERFYEDAFGDATSCEIYWKLCLKDEYLNRFSDYIMDDVFDHNVIDPGAVEVAYDVGTRSVSVDLKNRTYTLGDDFTKDRTDSSIVKFNFDADDESAYALIANSYILDTGITHNYKENFEITQIKLDLYLIAE